MKLVRYYLFEKETPFSAREVLFFFNKHYADNINDDCKIYFVYSIYYEFAIACFLKEYSFCVPIGARFILEAENFIKVLGEEGDKRNLLFAINDTRRTMEGIIDGMKILGIVEDYNSKIDRNTKILVRYYIDNKEVKGKYKKLYNDINTGMCEIIKVYK